MNISNYNYRSSELLMNSLRYPVQDFQNLSQWKVLSLKSALSLDNSVFVLCLYFALMFWKYLVECLTEWGIKQYKTIILDMPLQSSALDSDLLHWISFLSKSIFIDAQSIKNLFSILFLSLESLMFPLQTSLMFFTSDSIGCLHLILHRPNVDELFSSPLVLLRNY